MRLRIGAGTDVGLVRQGNEDAFIVEEPLFGVADGMGGHVAGEIASGTAVEAIEAGIKDSPPRDTGDLADLVRRANEAIWARAAQDPSLQGMGTTCTLLLFDDSQARLAHVGDSRAYMFREGELTQITSDHTLVERMVREGRITPEEARHHPQRSMITNALGVGPQVEVDELVIDLRPGDRLLVCSDGLSGMLNNAVIADTLAAESDPQRSVDALIDLAKKAGGDDNITVIVVEVVEEDRVDTAPDAAQAERPAPPTRRTPAAPIEARQRRWLRPVVITLSIVATILVGGYVAARYALANSWFVGVNEDGAVVVFNGIPDEIAGMSLKEEESTSGLELDELPEFKRADVEDGIKADSREDAERILAGLQELAKDQEFQQEPSQPRNDQSDGDRSGTDRNQPREDRDKP